MTPSIIYLITGANRGLGLALVSQTLAKHDDSYVYAGARDPQGSLALKELEGRYPGRISVVKYVAADVEGNNVLAKEIMERHGRVDTVIANSALANSQPTSVDVKPSDMEAHFQVNVIGLVVLFQSMHVLLRKSSNPRFVPITSMAGCLDGRAVRHRGYLAYGSSKAALNWATRKIHFENEWLTAFPQSPGVMDTDMFRATAATDESGLPKQWTEKGAPQPRDVALGILNIVDHSTREKEGGEFIHVDGTKVPWWSLR